MSVSNNDREIIDKIAVAKAKSHQQARLDHMAKPLAQRLQASWDLYINYRETANIRKRIDDPSPFYERARQLGLYLDEKDNS